MISNSHKSYVHNRFCIHQHGSRVELFDGLKTNILDSMFALLFAGGGYMSLKLCLLQHFTFKKLNKGYYVISFWLMILPPKSCRNFLDYLKLVEISTLLVLGCVEDEICFCTLTFLEFNLHNRLELHMHRYHNRLELHLYLWLRKWLNQFRSIHCCILGMGLAIHFLKPLLCFENFHSFACVVLTFTQWV